jgi:hypothetical protein
MVQWENKINFNSENMEVRNNFWDIDIRKENKVKMYICIKETENDYSTDFGPEVR